MFHLKEAFKIGGFVWTMIIWLIFIFMLHRHFIPRWRSSVMVCKLELFWRKYKKITLKKRKLCVVVLLSKQCFFYTADNAYVDLLKACHHQFCWRQIKGVEKVSCLCFLPRCNILVAMVTILNNETDIFCYYKAGHYLNPLKQLISTFVEGR